MYLKSSLLIVSIYFFTAAWSLGLSQNTIDEMVKLVNKHRKENGDVDRITMVEYKRKDKDLNKKFHSNGNEYNYKLEGVAMIDDKSLPDLLIYLSTLEKIIYQWKGKTFTTFEVNLFINIFKKKDEKGVEGVEGKGEVEGKGKSEGGGEGQDKGVDYGEPDGLLTHAELVSLIDDDSFLEPKHEEETKNEFNDGDSINALFFLDEGKREGKAESEGRGKGEGEGEGEGEGKGNGQGEGQAESQGKVQDKGVDKGEPNGLLTHAELVSLIDEYLNLDPEFEDNIKKEFNDGDSINALMFLATILKHKPNGKGLDMALLSKCSDLYILFEVNLPNESLNDLFLSFKIVSDEYVGLLRFDHVQPPANELQELLVFVSEYNKEVDENENLQRFTSLDVRHMIEEFSLYDLDSNGVLSYNEFFPLARNYKITEDLLITSPISELKLLVKLYRLSQSEKIKYEVNDNHDANGSMTTTTFFYLKFYLRIRQLKEEEKQKILIEIRKEEEEKKKLNEKRKEMIAMAEKQAIENARAAEEINPGLYERVHRSFKIVLSKERR